MLELLFPLLLLSVPLLRAGDPVGDFINSVIGGIKRIVDTIINNIVSFFNKYFFTPLGEGVAKVIKSVFDTLSTFVSALAAPFQGAFTAAVQVWNNFANYVSNYGPLGPVIMVAVIGLMIAIAVIFIKRIPVVFTHV